MEKFTWVSIYNQIAHKLLEYKENSKALANLMYEILEDTGLMYSEEKGSNLDGDGTKRFRYDEIDPISFMNRFEMYSDNNRKNFIEKFEEKSGLDIDIPKDFDGLPSTNPQKSCVIRFKCDREVEDVSNIWNLFDISLNGNFEDKEDKSRFIEAYNKVVSKPCAKFNISIGLFKIRPDVFLNLDSTNRDFIEKKLGLKIRSCPNGKVYLEIIDKVKEYIDSHKEFSTMLDFSYEAWKTKDVIEESDVGIIFNAKTSNAKFIKWFKPILDALKELGGSATPREVRNKIIEMMELPNEVTQKTRGKSKVKEFDNDVAWARSYLVHEGIINNRERGRWRITDKGIKINMTEEEASRIFFKWVEILKNRRENGIEETNYWLVGASWESWGDQTDRFLSEGIWENGYKDKYIEMVNSMMPGDKIAIKSTYTRQNGIPFDNQGKYVSVMNVKVTGTIIENYNNGQKVKVSWDAINEREWYMYTERNTIWNITPKDGIDDWMKEELVKFVFEGQEQDYEKFINDSFWKDRYETIENDIKEYVPYSKENFLKEVYLKENDYNELTELLSRKKNIILQGAPGVGKTFMAKRLAYSIIGYKDDTKIKFVQFHQSYSYEDFIEGWRPSEDGFKIEEGVFYKFCKEARRDSDNKYFFIIDEINRGNLSKIFGELLMLIEDDKREEKVTLAYSGKYFSVPENVYIIGMMNTADRSLAMMDYALRRRFSFYEINPAFDNEKFKEYQNNCKSEYFNEIIDKIKRLNKEIEKDLSLGKGFKIGHSSFCKLTRADKEEINSIIKYEIMPMLEEYWFDDLDRVKNWKNILLGE